VRMVDHPAAVLDGGLSTWTGELAVGWYEVEPASSKVRPWPDARLIDADGVEDLRHDAHSLLLDARASARFEAGDLTIDPRPGHIPGAASAPWTGNVAPDGTMLDPEALRARFVALGAANATTIACYCGSGVTACHDLLALDIAGLGEATRLYAGSWSQWGSDTSRPAATGPA
jgi:thiosulfate/3-mercaptopyruvate sulfurtransferase